jgi:O-antigen/teichoic acid export membrane protein
MYVALGALALGVSVLLAVVLPRIVDVHGEKRHLFVWLIVIAGAGVAVTLSCSTAALVLQALQRLDLLNLLSLLTTVLTVAGTVIAIRAGWGVLGVTAVTVATLSIMQLPTIWVARRLSPELRLGWRGGSRAGLRRVVSFSAASGGIQLSDVLSVRADVLIVGSVLGVAFVTPYALAQRLGLLVQSLTSQVVKVMLPIATELHARGASGDTRRLFLGATRLTLAMSLPVALTLALLAPEVLQLWVGPEYRRYATLLVLLVTYGLLDCAIWPAALVLMAMEGHRPLGPIAVAAGVANVVLSLILVRPFGLVGVAVASVIAAAVQSLLLVFPYAMRTIGVRGREVLAGVCLPLLLPTLALCGVIVGVRATADPESAIAITALACGAGAAFTAVYFAVGASRTERAAVGSLLRTTGNLVLAPLRRRR